MTTHDNNKIDCCIGGDDFIALNRTVIVGDSSVLEVCVGIIDDSEFEGDTDERFMLLATVEGGQDFKGKVILQPNSVIFAIEDNDCKSASFLS